MNARHRVAERRCIARTGRCAPYSHAVPSDDLARQLLDAQVAFHVDRLTGDRLADTIRELAAQVHAAAGSRQLIDLIDPEAVKQIVRRSLAEVPDSPGVAGILEMVSALVSAGPTERFTLGDVIERDHVESLIDELIGLSPVLERGLEHLTASPLVGTVASRFMGRVAGEVLATNQAIADKIPGLGSLTRLGTSAATKVGGAANKQFEGLIGKGGTFAVRGLNRIVVETIKDPTTREAVLQVWDLLASTPVGGLGEHIAADELTGVLGAGHELVASAAAREQVGHLADSIVDAFFEWFGGYSPIELLDTLQIGWTDVVDDLVDLAPTVAEALKESGELESIVRAQLEPFYDSAEVAAILG